MTATDGPALRANVISAARACFLRYGVQRTSMADVAKAVGITRQALYKVVASAEELSDAVVIERIREFADELRPTLEGAASFADAIVDTSVAAIDKARGDAELQNYFETSNSAQMHDVMSGHYPEVSDIVLDLFTPAFERGRQSGELRDDVSDRKMADWIRGVQLQLILRKDLEPDEPREVLREFLLPSLIRNS